MGLLDKVKSMLWCKKVIHTTLDPASVSENQTIRNLATELAELKGKEQRRLAEEAKQRESEKDKADEDLAKIQVNQRKQEIDSKNKLLFFSLKNLFNKMQNKDFRGIDIMTWNRGSVISKFEDLGFSQDGQIVLLGEGKRVILKGKEIKDIFQHPPAIEHDFMKAKSIVVNLDDTGGYVENVQTIECADIIPNNDGTFRYSAKRKPLYEFIKEYREQLGDYQYQIEEKDTIIKEMSSTIEQLKRGNRVLEKQYSVSQATTSEMENEFTSATNVMNRTNQELSQQRMLNANLEEQKERLQSAFDTILQTAEREMSKTTDNKAQEKFQDAVNTVQNMIMPLAQQQLSNVTKLQNQEKKEDANESPNN